MMPRQPKESASAPGRPKDPAKRHAILRAAQLLFMTQGLSATSMDEVARQAGVSKLTLYSHFADKEDLFQQAVAEKCHEHLPAETFAAAASLPLRAALVAIGCGFVALVFSDAALGLQRLLSVEAPRHPKIGELFWAAGPQRVCDDFARFLQPRIAAGEIAGVAPETAAEHFFSMLKGLPHMRALMKPDEKPSAKEAQAHVDSVVDLFLRAYGRPPPTGRKRQRLR